MLQIIQNEFFKCKLCRKKYSENNFPISLSCTKTLCKECFDCMNNNNNICPFDSSHKHTKENSAKNICLIKIMEDINNIINLNKPEEKIDNKLKNFSLVFEDLKKINRFSNEEFIFKGELKDNKPIGAGQLIYKKIGIFNGTFNGEFHKGKGKIIYNDNSLFIGEWENYKRQGYGILDFTNFDKYEGEFKDDLYNGKGKLYIYDQKIIYEGFWKNGKKEGNFKILNDEEKLIKMENYKNDIIQ